VSWKREGANVVLTLTQDQYEMLTLALGIAAGRASRDGDTSAFNCWLILANAVNEGNPGWTPYEVPAEVSP
jgi:hypothetical protein